MDHPIGTAIAGAGFAVIVAKSGIGGWVIRKPVNAVVRSIAWGVFGVYDWKRPEEWCLYCVGFWCGVILNLCGYSIIGNPVMTGLAMTGILWPLAELTDLSSALWVFLTDLIPEGTGYDDGIECGASPGHSEEGSGESDSSG